MGINGSANAVVTFNQRDFALGNSTGNGATTNQELELMRRSNRQFCEAWGHPPLQSHC